LLLEEDLCDDDLDEDLEEEDDLEEDLEDEERWDEDL
jgi:hypothetical protein